MRKGFKTILIFNWVIWLLAGGQAPGQTAEYPSDSLSCLWRQYPNRHKEDTLHINWSNVWQSSFFAQSAAPLQEPNLPYCYKSLSFNEIDNLWIASAIDSDNESPNYPLILDMSDWVYYGKKPDITTLERQIVTVKTGYYLGYPYWYGNHWYWNRTEMEPFFEERPWYPSSPYYLLHNRYGSDSYLYPMQYVEIRINLDMNSSFHTGLFTSD